MRPELMRLIGIIMLVGGLAGQAITLVANLWAIYGAGNQEAMFLSETWWDSWWYVYALCGPVIVIGAILGQMGMRR